MCSPIWPPRWPMARTASTESVSCGGIASTRSGRSPRRPRLWRLVDERIDAARLPRIRAARAHARERAWAAGAAPARDGWLHIDVDATHHRRPFRQQGERGRDLEAQTFGFHSLLMFLDRPDIAAGEALAGLLRAGNAGSNTTADHIAVLGQALDSLPPQYRPSPDNPARTDRS